MNPFLTGYAATLALQPIEADEHWAAWSRQLSDGERARVEACGYAAGVSEAKDFLEWEKRNCYNN